VAEAVGRLVDEGPRPALRELLSADEVEALMDRARAVLAGGHFPHDPTGRRYPWPLV
jgi:hypothetical protein